MSNIIIIGDIVRAICPCSDCSTLGYAGALGIVERIGATSVRVNFGMTRHNPSFDFSPLNLEKVGHIDE